jgi:hypothetical protein
MQIKFKNQWWSVDHVEYGSSEEGSLVIEEDNDVFFWEDLAKQYLKKEPYHEIGDTVELVDGVFITRQD